MTWDNANTWANNLDYGGFDDWRLPTAKNQDNSGPCAKFGCSESEMGHMFYNNLGGTAGQSILSASDPNNYLEGNGGPLTNVQSYVYWSGTEYAPFPGGVAWYFTTANGYQRHDGKGNDIYAWAVRSGDVSAVPVPAAVWLFGSGLVGLIGFSKRRKAA